MIGSLAHRIMVWPYLILSYQLELALACLDAWEFAPAQPRFEPEVCPATPDATAREVAGG